MARSPIETTPTGRSPLTTGTRRIAFFRISSMTLSASSSGETVVTSPLQIFSTGVRFGSCSSATPRMVMSRSVTTPQICPPSLVTSSAPTFASFIFLAQSASGVLPETLIGSLVMMSRTSCPIENLLPARRQQRLGHPGHAPDRRGPLERAVGSSAGGSASRYVPCTVACRPRDRRAEGRRAAGHHPFDRLVWEDTPMRLEKLCYPLLPLVLLGGCTKSHDLEPAANASEVEGLPDAAFTSVDGVQVVAQAGEWPEDQEV